MSTPIRFNTTVNGFCVARPNGTYAVAFSDGILIQNGTKLPKPNGQQVIWIDLSANGKIAGTSQQVDNIAWEWNGIWVNNKCYSVPRACIYKPDNTLVTVQTPTETGSLGYIQVSDSGQLVQTKDQYADPSRGIYEYIIRGNVTVGHGGKSNLGENPLICIIDNKTYLLEKGNCLCVKFYRDGENCAIAWINGAISNIWFPTVTELKTFPVYNPQPIPEPPEPGPEPMPIPNHKDVVERMRLKYNGMPEGPARGYTITNAVAWELRDEGAGTFFKDSGTQYNNRSIDIVIYKHRVEDPAGKGQTFDILGDAEGRATPQWARTQPTGYGDERVWRAPVEPPNPEPTPPTPTNPDRDMLIHIRDEINEFLGE